jgi:hypothetical protein
MMKPNSKPWFCLRALGRLIRAGLLIVAATNASAAIYTVTTTSDAGFGSLRQAILDAESNPGSDVISFNLPGSGPFAITPLTGLPSIRESVTIDGSTQPGFTSEPLVELRGSSAGSGVSGLYLLTSNCLIRALCINQFARDGIRIENFGSNVISGCYIGTDVHGTNGLGNGQGGITVLTAGNLIGGTNASDRNVISGGNLTGIYLLYANARDNQVLGNYIGLDATGGRRLGNVENGVVLASAPENVVGGTNSGAGNVISGNGQSGVYILNPDASGNRVLGNFIGTDASGFLALSNVADGITIFGGTATVIGGTNAGAGNVLSGNAARGIYVTVNLGGGASNMIQGNFIGVNVAGTGALPNAGSGVELYQAADNTIGGGNVISGNLFAGVTVSDGLSVNNRIVGNLIGPDVLGTSALGNYSDGVLLFGVSNNVVGGLTTVERNVISGNGQNGVYLFGTATRSNAVLGNYIGADISGRQRLGNGLSGVRIEGPNNLLGGGASGARNVVSGNSGNGIYIYDCSASNNIVAGNLIGLDAGGSSPLGNTIAGVGITNAPANTIGGAGPGAGNVISANSDNGIYLQATGAVGNAILGNFIGTDVSGMLARGNALSGIYALSAPSNSVGGAVVGARNVISANGLSGIRLRYGGTDGWIIQGNYIGTAVDGDGNLGNYLHGIELYTDSGASFHVIGGTAPGEGNRIAFTMNAGYDGVRIRDGCTNNLVVGNAIWGNGGSSPNGLGIDLGVDGVTPNDDCDADYGSGAANNSQNFPALSAAYASGTATGVRGSLNSVAGKSYAIDFYANPTNEPSGYGEGQVYLGRISIQTPADNCTTNFTASLPVPTPTGYFVTATATDAANNTSEFSQGIPVAPQPALAVSNLAATQKLWLAWTNSAEGFALQQATNLSPPVVWSLITNAPTLSGGQYVLTPPTTNGNRFYRLILQ